MPNFRQRLRPRFAALGAVVLAVLGLLLVRLWSMQVLSGAAFAQQADQNRVREITTEAPRGRILDRKGREMVTNRATLAVVVQPSVASDQHLLDRLSSLLDVPVPELKQRIADKRLAALAPRVVAVDVPMRTVAYLSEHEAEFPGVEVEERAVRRYPMKRLAAHVLGYTGQVSQDELESSQFSAYVPGDLVGKAGAESSFESVLQGDRGQRLLEVDATGKPRRIISEIEPQPGRDVVLTIDSKVQRVTEKALADALKDAHKDHFTKARAGAAVAMDVKTGEVIAMASAPSYDPEMFLGGVSQRDWSKLTDKDSEYPLTNRAIQAQYPAASTFKAITGLAGLTYSKTGQGTSFYCAGKWTGMGDQWKKYCWKHSGHGNISFWEGIVDSCDTVFYEIGYDFYKDKGEKLQKFARRFGFGSSTGVDLPGEAAGRVPDKAWKAKWNEDYPEYRRWLPGDTVNMAIGQGDLLVTPLQIASAYAGIANGGKIMKPHVLKQVLGGDHKAVLNAKPEVLHDTKVSKADLAVMKSALVGVTESGTGKGAFRGFPERVAGKTGTAQVAGKDDYAWFVGYLPADNPKYCVAVVVEQGGHGGSIAGPAARQIMGALMGLPVEHITAEDASR